MPWRKGIPVYGVGKISDIFAGQGISESFPTKGNQAGIDQVVQLMEEKREDCLIFANLVDFDMLWGHRNDAAGYAKGLEEFDARLPEIMAGLRSGDLLFILADHGCDPTFPGTDHTREYVPLLVAERVSTQSIWESAAALPMWPRQPQTGSGLSMRPWGSVFCLKSDHRV